MDAEIIDIEISNGIGTNELGSFMLLASRQLNLNP